MIVRMLYSATITTIDLKKLIFVQSLVLLLIFHTSAFAQWQNLSNLSVTNIQVISIDPTNPTHIWVGADSTSNKINEAGLYYSQDSGLTWSQVNSMSNQGESLTGKVVNSISLTADNTSADHFMLVAFSDIGIFRSTDGGRTFTEAQIQHPQSSSQFLTQNVDKVVITKQDLNWKLYAVVNANDYTFGTASTSGIYSTTISSTTQALFWQKVDSLQLPINKLIVDPNNSNILYIATSDSRLMKSIDGGHNFIDSNSGLPSGPQMIISDLVIDTTTNSTLYISVSQSNIPGLYKSTNSGLSWTIVNSSEGFNRLSIGNSIGLKKLYAIKSENSFSGNQPQYSVLKSDNEGLTWSQLENSLQNILTGNKLGTIKTHNGILFVGGKDGLFTFNIQNSKSKPLNLSSRAENSNRISLTVNPANITITAGRSLTFNLNATNQTDSSLTNVTITSAGLPSGIQAVLLSNGCSLDNSIITCQIGSLNVNEPVVLSISVIMPDTLPNSLQTISFTLDAPALNQPIITSVDSSSSIGSLIAHSGTATVTVGDKYSTGEFIATNANAETEYVLSGDLPTNGTFLWNSQSCDEQISCSDGNFSYIPHENSGGKTETIQFYARDKTTFAVSELAEYIITIENRENRAASIGPLALLVLIQIGLFTRFRRILRVNN